MAVKGETEVDLLGPLNETRLVPVAPSWVAKIWGENDWPKPVSPFMKDWYTAISSPSYLDSDIIEAKTELAKAGFVDIDGDGFVEMPNGSALVFRPIYGLEHPAWKGIIENSAEYWTQIGIDVKPQGWAMCSAWDHLYNPGSDFEAVLTDLWIGQYAPTGLAHFVTDQFFQGNRNYLGWCNTTYDAVIDTFLNASTRHEVVAAAHHAQQILMENVPVIAYGTCFAYYAHRSDRFSNWPLWDDTGFSSSADWVPRMVQIRPGHIERNPYSGTGGELTIGQPYGSGTYIDFWPFYHADSSQSLIYNQMFDTLCGPRNPEDNSFIPRSGLALDWTFEPHGDGLRYVFDIVDNATWHDHEPVTAEDVAFSYNYVIEKMPDFSRIENILQAKALNDTHIEILTNSTSYWVFERIASRVIIPKHVWECIIDPWMAYRIYWEEPPIGCGPFKLKSFRDRYPGVKVTLEYWEHYHYALPRPYVGPLITPVMFLVFVGILVISLTTIGSIVYLKLDRDKW